MGTGGKTAENNRLRPEKFLLKCFRTGVRLPSPPPKRKASPDGLAFLFGGAASLPYNWILLRGAYPPLSNSPHAKPRLPSCIAGVEPRVIPERLPRKGRASGDICRTKCRRRHFDSPRLHQIKMPTLLGWHFYLVGQLRCRIIRFI